MKQKKGRGLADGVRTLGITRYSKSEMINAPLLILFKDILSV
jgi:hypothetical protein